jgi:hypothetical protein
MIAEIVPFRSRADIEFLQRFLPKYRRLGPREQRAFRDALCRTVDDGQPFEEAMVELFVELGRSPEEARETVRACTEPP